MTIEVNRSEWTDVVQRIGAGWQICELDYSGTEICGRVDGAAGIADGVLSMPIVWEAKTFTSPDRFEAPISARSLRILSDNSIVIGSTDRFWTFVPAGY